MSVSADKDHELPLDRLRPWLREHVGLEGELQLQRFPGGQSNPTYRLQAGDRAVVLRRRPAGPALPSAHAVEREYRVLAALQREGSVPVPPVHGLCEDPEVIGSAFYVMDEVPGRILREPTLPGLDPAQRRAHYLELMRVAGRMHAVDVQAAGLADFGGKSDYVGRQVARWQRQYAASAAARIESFERLGAWLTSNLQAARGPERIVHGDYRLENVIFAPDAPTISAVIDWELATLGDPLADIAYCLMAWRLMPGPLRGLAGEDLAALGIPAEAELLAVWCAAAGHPEPGPREWEFHIAFNLFRLAGILHGIAGRAMQGTAASADAVRMGELARPVAEMGWRTAQRLLRTPAHVLS